MRRFAAALLLFLFAAAPAAAGPERAKLTPGGSAKIVEIVDGDTVILADRRQVRLVGIQAPKLPLGRRNFPTWPLAEAAKAYLEKLAAGREAALSYGGARTDRHGRQLAHLHLDDDSWIQGRMIAAGMARVYTFPDNRALASELLALERRARAEKKGIWGLDFYKIRTPEELGDAVGTFQIVEGRVIEAALVKGRGFLNFGPDRATDFTITVPPEAVKEFRAAGIDLAKLAGRSVRVRGWIASRQGPQIEASHPEQLEIGD